jgi:hypothetical protein
MFARKHSADCGAPTTDPEPRRRRLLRDTAPRTRSVLLATGLLAIGITSIGVAANGSPLREGKRNGTTSRETQIVGNFASSTGLKGGYVTRQSNLSSSGGGAVYGCRSQAGGSLATPTPQNPCIRANNLSRGLAFEFNSTIGDVVGSITSGTGGDTKKPFVTNATGVATGLNADRVDNLDAAQIVAAARDPFAQVTGVGAAGESRGLATTAPITHTIGSGVYAIKFTSDLSKCAFTATIAENSFGEITAISATAASVTTVTVRTATSNGTLQDRAFHLAASC